MIVLIVGLFVFFGTHFFIMKMGFEKKLTLSRKEKQMRALHGLLSLLGFALIVYGFYLYRMNGYIQLWQPPLMMRHLALILNMPVFVLVAAGFFHGYIKYSLKYPMLVGVKLWALAHLLANGDLGSLILFGAFLGWAVILRILAKKRGLSMPVLNKDIALRNDLISVLMGLGVYIAMLRGLHDALIGVSPI